MPEAILQCMSILPKAVQAKPARTAESKKVAWLYAIILDLMALFQILSFSRFIMVIDSYWLPGGLPSSSFIAGALIGAELLAIPFLLRLKLSPAFRVFSMGLSWVVALAWLLLTLDAQITTNDLRNVGFLGGDIQLVPGWWAVCISVAFGVLAIWASWGLWPFKVAKRSNRA